MQGIIPYGARGCGGLPERDHERERGSRTARIGQLPVPAIVVEPVAHHELVRDHEPHVVHVHVHLPAGDLVEEAAERQAPGMPGREVPAQVADGPPRVDHVLHDDHVTVLDGE